MMPESLFKAKPLSSAAKDALLQLFVSGPTWDGNLISKSGRSELIELGLAFNGWQSLTEEGVRVASEWDHAGSAADTTSAGTTRRPAAE